MSVAATSSIRCPRGITALVMLCLGIVGFSTDARAQEVWTLTTGDFGTRRVILQQMDASVLSIVEDASPATLPLRELLRLERAPAPQTLTGRYVLLRTGEKLTGEVRELTAKELVWQSASLGEVRLPIELVRSIVIGESPRSGERATEDVVRLSNGDTVRGILAELNPTAAAIQATGGETTSIPMASIASIEFAATPAGGRLRKLDRFRLMLTDGSVLATPSISLSRDSFSISLPGGRTQAVRMQQVASIQHLDGPVLFLSDLTPAESVQTPYLGETAAARMNQTVAGGPIQFGARTFVAGIGVHSHSRLVFDVPDGFQVFRTQYAIAGDLPYADVTVRVMLDDAAAYEKANVRAGTLSAPVVLELKGARRVTLEVDFGENFDVQDRLNWIEAAFLRELPKPPPPPVVQIPSTMPATVPAEPADRDSATQPATQPSTRPGA